MAKIKNSNAKTIGAIFLGSILEWYDFGLFIFFMPTISSLFFPNPHHYLSIIYGYSILAISYFIRPLGAMIFGYFGDKFSKKSALIFTLIFMSVPSLLIGLLPTYQQIGGFAALFLIILRLIQGLSAGGELMGAVILTYEITTLPFRGMLSCLVWTGSGAGMLLASLCVTGLLHFVDKSTLMDWAWRMPFILGAGLGLIAFYLRRYYLQDKIQQPQKSQQKNFISQVFIHHKDKFFQFIALFAPVACIFYLGFFYMPVYASEVGSLSYTKVLTVNMIVMIGFQIFPTVFGYFLEPLSKPFWRNLSLFLLVILSLPAYMIISHKSSLIYFSIVQLSLVIITSLNASATMLSVLEDSPPQVRYTLVALSYNISYAIFGNLLPLMTVYLMFKWHFWLLPAITIITSCLLSGIYLCFFSRQNLENNVQALQLK